MEAYLEMESSSNVYLQCKLTTRVFGSIHKVGILPAKSYFKTIVNMCFSALLLTAPYNYTIYSSRIKH